MAGFDFAGLLGNPMFTGGLGLLAAGLDRKPYGEAIQMGLQGAGMAQSFASNQQKLDAQRQELLAKKRMDDARAQIVNGLQYRNHAGAQAHSAYQPTNPMGVGSYPTPLQPGVVAMSPSQAGQSQLRGLLMQADPEGAFRAMSTQAFAPPVAKGTNRMQEYAWLSNIYGPEKAREMVFPGKGASAPELMAGIERERIRSQTGATDELARQRQQETDTARRLLVGNTKTAGKAAVERVVALTNVHQITGGRNLSVATLMADIDKSGGLFESGMNGQKMAEWYNRVDAAKNPNDPRPISPQSGEMLLRSLRSAEVNTAQMIKGIGTELAQNKINPTPEKWRFVTQDYVPGMKAGWYKNAYYLGQALDAVEKTLAHPDINSYEDWELLGEYERARQALQDVFGVDMRKGRSKLPWYKPDGQLGTGATQLQGSNLGTNTVIKTPGGGTLRRVQ